MSPFINAALTTAALTILVVAGCGWIWIRTRGSFYRKLFAEAHFLEVGQKIGVLKQTALSNIGIEDAQKARSPDDDPRWFRTEAGLAVFYTITNESPGKYVHHAVRKRCGNLYRPRSWREVHSSMGQASRYRI